MKGSGFGGGAHRFPSTVLVLVNPRIPYNDYDCISQRRTEIEVKEIVK